MFTIYRWDEWWCYVEHNSILLYISSVGLKLTQAARKHRIGAARIAHVLGANVPQVSSRPSGEPEYVWVGPGDRGLELEIIGVPVDIAGESVMLIIHVMPTGSRRK